MCDMALVSNELMATNELVVIPTAISNGHHLSSNNHSSSTKKHSSSSNNNRDKDREKEKHRDHHHKSSSSKDHKSSNREKDRHHTSSSSNKDKHRDKDRKSSNSHNPSSSHRDKDKEKEKHRSTSSSQHKNSSKDKDRKDRDHEKEHHRDREKEHRDREKEHRDREKEHRDREKEPRDRDREKEHRERKDGEKERQKDKDRHHHKSSLSTTSKPRDKDKDKEHGHKSSSHSSHKHSSSKSSNSHRHHQTSSSAQIFAKPEPIEPERSNGVELLTEEKPNYKEYNGYNGFGNMQVEVENYNNVSQTSSCDYSMSQFKADEPDFVIKQEASLTDAENEEYEENNVTADQVDDGDDVPLAIRKRKQVNNIKTEDDNEDVPLIARKKIKKEHKDSDKKKRKHIKEEGDDYSETKSKIPKPEISVKVEVSSPTKRVKKEKKPEEEEVWRWWEEEKRDDGVKWNTLEHKGPVFAPPYERLPSNVRFFYDGRPMDLSKGTEEAATFYAKMLNHDYCTKDIFNSNFFKDFRKVMTSKEREIIRDFKKCNFQEMFEYFQAESEKRKAATKEQKQAKKSEGEALIQEYGYCYIDGHREKIANFRLEPPGLFRGRGEHPKMGMIKKRVLAADISINCGKNSKIPSPPPGERWKEVRHDNTVTWLVSWVENVQGQVKYIMLNPSSKLKGEKDHVKYETARRLAQSIDKIRSTYRDEWKSKEMRVRQRAVALYFIDKLALRAGNEKDEDQADTVGCCSLRVEHVSLHKELNGKENVVAFDFLGKDSIRYYNEVEVEKRVFKNLELFMENKKAGDDLFDRLNTQVLNEHLKELMDGLTAKVFRTYNASITLQNQLDLLTEDNMTVPEKLLAYNRANRAVAILCNHQRSVPKGHEKSMENIKAKIKAKREAIAQCEEDCHDLKKAAKHGSVKEKMNYDKKVKQLERLKEQLKKLELQETDRDENKTIALGTSKLNYLDPRITVAWCKKHEVPIDKIFNKTQRNKFLWAIHMADENYRF